jgi:hypothetical protein
LYNLHLNGDIVRCPDIAAIKEREAEIKDSHKICVYNIKEESCQVWQNSLKCWQNVKDKGCDGRCMLSGQDICPGHQAQRKTGNKEKSFRIDNVNYRKLSSSAHYLVKKSQHKTLFLTLTFPKFKKKINEKHLNKAFSTFMHNLRENYNCSGYVAVRERGANGTHRYHYHLLCSIPFVPFADLNRAWCHAISDICEFSKRAVTSDKKTLFIREPVRALRYVCKYFAKTKGQSSKTRIIFISENLIRTPVHFNNENCEYYTINDLLDSFKSISKKETSDYTTAFRINDAKEFSIFCEKILYKFFNLPREGLIDLYSFPN